MSRRISVEIGRDGRLQVEYSGYPGETCFEEAEVLSKALRELGLWAIPVTVTRKSASQIELEVGVGETPGEKVPVG